MTTCKSCSAEIIWIKTKAGKSAPIDAKAIKVFVKSGDGWILEVGHQSHFATCPNADQHRKK
jgi:ketosteroid isomerase-like protein